ncbi:MAG: SDR family NAD(P)-dependent oxidoreductase [Agromyces sp.]
MRLENRVIVVTGGASGIGAGFCRGFAAEGAAVVIADLDLARAEALAVELRDSGARALAVHMDVADRASVQAGIAATLAEFGSLDAYFNNAGMNAPMKYLEVTEENFERIMRINALGVLIGTQEAAKAFIQLGKSGKIINTASIAGRQGYSSFAPYSAAKAAVISLTQSGARALAEHHITVNAFAPGVVDTPLWTKLDADLEAIGEGQNGFASMASGILLGRAAEPSDIVPVAVFLASADSDYTTGQVIMIDGGMVLV